MSDSDFFSGVPVAVDPAEIERTLASYWHRSPGSDAADTVPVATRACLSNIIALASRSGGDEDLAELLRAVSRRFPSRVIVLAGEPEDGRSLAAWISAVCHVRQPGSPPVCCERIVLRSARRDVGSLLGAVTPLLVPDVPVVLLAFDAAALKLAGKFAGVVDRVIVDGAAVGRDGYGRIVERVDEDASVSIDDLAWAQIAPWRAAVRDVFSEPRARVLLAGLSRLEAEFEPALTGGRLGSAAGKEMDPAAPARLFAGWVASRLGFTVAAAMGESHRIWARLERDGRAFEIVVRAGESRGERPGELSRVRLESGESAREGFLDIERDGASCLFHVKYRTAVECVLPRRMAAPDSNRADALSDLLRRAPGDSAYERAVRIAAKLV